MKRWLVLLVCVAFILVAIPFPAKGDMQLPQFQLGDQWVYSVSIKIEGMAILSGEWTFEVEDETTVSGHDVYGMSLEGDGTATFEGLGALPYVLDGYTYIRRSDLAIVNESMMIDFDASIIGVDAYLIAYMNMSYDPPLDQFNFPIKEGNTWSTTTSATYDLVIISNFIPSNETSTTVAETADFEVESRETVDVAAGTFSTYVIKMTAEDGSVNYTYMSTKSGYMVKMRMFDSVGASLGTMNLKSYTYTAPANGDGEDADDMDFWWLLLIVIIVVVILLTLALFRRSRKEQEPPTNESVILEELPPPEETNK